MKSGMIFVNAISMIYLLYSLPVLLGESKGWVARSLAMAEEELQMPWYNHF
jgi:hypothetical protein